MHIKNIKIPSYDNFDPCYQYWGEYPIPQLMSFDVDYISLNKITLFYGSNGSGKSTLINLIAEKLGCTRNTTLFKKRMKDSTIPFNKCLMHTEIIIEENENFPRNIRYLSSDEVFNKLENIKVYNNNTIQQTDNAKAECKKILSEPFHYNGSQDYEYMKLRNKVNFHYKQYMSERVDVLKRQQSNGEEALDCYINVIEPNGIYLLDEPENCLSPKYQLKLVKIIETAVRYENCQFIIATHSPILLSMDCSNIYDLDEKPIRIKEWHQLENVKLYYEFFKDNKDLFESKEYEER